MTSSEHHHHHHHHHHHQPPAAAPPPPPPLPPSIGMDNTEWIIICVYLSFLSLLGTAGNALVLVVFYRKKDKQVSTFFILVLAIVDFTTCLVLVPCTIWMEYWDFHISQDFVCKSYMMLNGGMIHFSALIMVAIALERYLSICHPFLRVLTLKRAKYILVGLASIATGLGICIALTHGVVDGTSDHYPIGPVNYTEEALDFHITTAKEDDAIQHLEGITFFTSGHHWLENTVSPAVAAAAATEMYKSTDNQTAEHLLMCEANDLVLSHEFQTHFQRLSNTLYLVYLAIVIVLYALIYRSVMTRRARRQKQKSACLMQVRQAQEKAKMAERIVANAKVQANAISLQCIKEENEIKDIEQASDNNCNDLRLATNATFSTKTTRIEEDPTTAFNSQQAKGPQKTRQSRKQKNKKQMVDGTMLANMKTAAMLFVVTVVFFVTFTPAFLSAIQLIDYKAYVFYLYFANNVANPIIYSFMNRNFRIDLKKLFCNKVDGWTTDRKRQKKEEETEMMTL